MANENTTVRTISHEQASRLPEPSWTWRRALIYIGTLWAQGICTWTVWRVIEMAGSARSLSPDQLTILGVYVLVIKYSFYTVWGVIVLYGVAASVTDLASLASAVRTTRKETITTAPPTAKVTTPTAVVAPVVDPTSTGPRPYEP